jgi:Arp2/3 complex, 34 kD subunit p34-Arc
MSVWSMRWIRSPRQAVSSSNAASRLRLILVYTEERDALINSASLLKRNALAAPFERAFSTQKTLESAGSTDMPGELMEIHYRDEEAIYVQASHDRVTVFFSTIFKDETDRTFGKVFLQVTRIPIHLNPL